MKFPVRREKPELIRPAKPTPREIKQLSDVDDQHNLRFHYPMIVFYRDNPYMKGEDPVRPIREAVAKALVYYYPLAGRLFEGPNRKLMVDCTAEGVVFVEAVAEVSLEQLLNVMQPLCSCSEELLHDVPGSSGMLDCPLMLIQVTRLICGGFVFAIRVNHVMSDGSGLVQFLNAVSQMIKGASSPSPLPVWRRKILTARNPPRFTHMHNEYEVIKKENDADGSSMVLKDLVHVTFFFGPKEIKAIKTHLPAHIHSITRFDLITACIWRSRAVALEFQEDEVVSLTVMATIRRKNGIDLPNGYYGNTMISSAVESKAKTLCNNSLGYSAELVKKARTQVDENYARSVIDFMFLHGKPGFYSRRNFIVSDVSRIGINEMDFGWGKPIYGGMMDGGTFYNSVYSNFQNNEGEEGLMVPVCLPFAAMGRFKEEMRKLTQVMSRV